MRWGETEIEVELHRYGDILFFFLNLILVSFNKKKLKIKEKYLARTGMRQTGTLQNPRQREGCLPLYRTVGV